MFISLKCCLYLNILVQKYIFNGVWGKYKSDDTTMKTVIQ